MDLLNIKQAAQFLGKHPQTLERYQRCGILKYDAKIGNKRYFTRQTLEAFKSGIDRLISLEEIAQKYTLTWEQAYDAMRLQQSVEPTDSFGRTLFRQESVEIVAKAEGWIEKESDADRVRRCDS